MTESKQAFYIQQAKLGKQSAFNSLLEYYWTDIFRFQLSKNNNENEAEDITIRTFAKAFDKINTYDEVYNFKTWLISISKNIFIDDFRKQKTSTISLSQNEQEFQNISDEGPSPEDKLIIEQNLAQLLTFIKQLKPHYQEIINLRYFQELSYKEIAEKLQEPMSNVKIKLLRAKKLLAEVIQLQNE